jgi:hypothetical protein
MMASSAYTVQKLARLYWVTRLAATGDQPLAKDLAVETTPLESVARTILADCGIPPAPAAATAFADRFLTALVDRRHGIVTISASKIGNWLQSESLAAA